MKHSIIRTYYGLLLIPIVFFSCGYNDGDWGATVSGCDEICTIYYTAQRELMKDEKLYDRNFPSKELRRKHVVKIKNGHKIESWFFLINEKNDTTRNEFSCEVYFDTKKIGYVVKNLKRKQSQ